MSELRARLSAPDPHERRRLLGELLREARDTDVWLFVSPAEVASEFPSVRDMLTPHQNDLVNAFFRHGKGFFLTGGAALAGFHLHGRETSDLDLFTAEPKPFERGSHALWSRTR